MPMWWCSCRNSDFPSRQFQKAEDGIWMHRPTEGDVHPMEPPIDDPTLSSLAHPLPGPLLIDLAKARSGDEDAQESDKVF